MRRAYYRARFWEVLDSWTWPPTPIRKLIRRKFEREFIGYARARGDQFYD